MLDLILDPFRSAIGQRALLEVLLLGLACGPLSVWIVLFRQSYAAESIAHAALPGLVIASLAGLPLLLGAGAGLAVAALAVGLAGRVRNVGADTAVAVVITTLFGLGVLLALDPDAPARLGEILFGDPLSVSHADLAASGALATVVLASLAASQRQLSLAGFDQQASASLGAGRVPAEVVLLLVLGLATLVAIQALGNLLVVALLVAPGAAALRWSRRLVPALCLAAGLAMGAGVAGIYASYHLEIAAGAAIALASLVPYALSLPGATVRGRGATPVDTLAAKA